MLRMVRLSEISSEKSCWNEKIKGCDRSGWLCWVCSFDWLVSMSSTSAGGKDADLTFSSLVWCWGYRPHLIINNNSNKFLSPGLNPAAQLTFWLLPVCLYSHCYSTGHERYCSTQEVPLKDISDNEILHYTLMRNFSIYFIL